MHSGLVLIFLANVLTAFFGVLFYRYIILRDVGLLSPDEVRLLRKYPTHGTIQSYTPSTSLVRAAPPMRWTGWRDFFTSTESPLSRDAQVYLLFQRACILTSAVCAVIASVFLLPSYWFGTAVFPPGSNTSPHSLMALLRSDRGIFERLTSHNLQQDSPLCLLQVPVFVIVTVCIIAMYSVVNAAAGETRSVDEWLQTALSSSTSIIPSPHNRRSSQSSPTPRFWTVFARGLPHDISSADYLYDMLDSIFPSQVARVELVCNGKVSEARLLRNLSSARHRLEYMYNASENDTIDVPPPSNKLITRIFNLFTRKRTRAEMLSDLESKVEQLERDLQSRKAAPVRDFRGCAFIAFRTAEATASALNDFPLRVRPTLAMANRHSDDNPDLPDDINHMLAVDDLSYPTASEEVNHSSSSILGEHRRTVSELEVPYFRNLAKATANLLPSSLRNRIVPSPTNALLRADNRNNSQSLDSPLSEVQQREIALTRLRNMKAERAPKSGDVIWKNLGMSFLERSVREMAVQIVVFAGLILFTSPVTMLTALKLVFAELALLTDPQGIFGNGNNSTSPSNFSNGLNETNGLTFFTNISADSGAAVQSLSHDLLNILPSFLTSNTYLTTAILAYFPVLLLAFVFSVVPSLLRLTCTLEGYPTRSAMEMSVFRKTSFYYVMNAVVLPSLALNTASEFLAMVYKQSNGGVNVSNALPILQRLFSGDIAYFLCCYLVQLALTGSVSWLMRVPSSFSMMIRKRLAMTPLEVAEAKCAGIFDYPRHYAYNVTVMSMVLLFGLMAPLMWWFALFYFLCKHAVDVYTLRYVHPRTHIDGRLPRLSGNFILTWTIVSQFSLAVILYLEGWVHGAIVTVILSFLTLIACLAVPSTVGNHMLSIVAVMRDAALERMLRIFGTHYSLLDEAGFGFRSSSSSGSHHSLVGMHENETLLRSNDSYQRSPVEDGQFRSLNPDLVDDRSSNPVSMRRSSRPNSGNMSNSLDSSVAIDVDASITISNKVAHVNMDDSACGTSLDGESLAAGYDSDAEGDDEAYDCDLVDAESGRSNLTRNYGTCTTGRGKTPNLSHSGA